MSSDDGFAPPDGWDPAEICPLSGQLATERCHQRVVEHFAPNTEPVHDCAVHIGVGNKTVVDLPTKYHGWARRTGQPLAEHRVSSGGEVHVEILSPRDGQVVLRDPEAPKGRSTMVLRATVDPPVGQVVWYVDGEPLEVVEAPYTARWTIEPGEHVFEARAALVDAGSGEVRVTGGVMATPRSSDPRSARCPSCEFARPRPSTPTTYGGVDWPWSLRPQQLTVSSSRTPQVWCAPALIILNFPPGGSACPSAFNPQHRTV